MPKSHRTPDQPAKQGRSLDQLAVAADKGDRGAEMLLDAMSSEGQT